MGRGRVTHNTILFVYPFLVYHTRERDTISGLSREFNVKEAWFRELNGFVKEFPSDLHLGNRVLLVRRDWVDYHHLLQKPSMEDVKELEFERVGMAQTPQLILLGYETARGTVYGRFSIDKECITFDPEMVPIRGYIDISCCLTSWPILQERAEFGSHQLQGLVT